MSPFSMASRICISVSIMYIVCRRKAKVHNRPTIGLWMPGCPLHPEVCTKPAMCSFATVDILHKINLRHGVVAAGHHRGVYELKEYPLSREELDVLNTLSPRKQSEWMASRELLFQIAGLPERTACLYDDFGKPYLRDSKRFISISHSELWCAAMISDVACGVDIQVYNDTVSRIAPRFLSAEEQEMAAGFRQPVSGLHVLWGAKECLYKAYGKRKLGFREHIFIRHLDFISGKGKGEIAYEGLHLPYEIEFRLLPECAWVFGLQRADMPADHSG